MTTKQNELENIHGVNEGLQHRIKQTAKNAISFHDWVEKIKTRRYTRVRLQRMFVHILTNTPKQLITTIVNEEKVPYIRLLGMSQTGQAFINKTKHNFEVPMITNLNNQTRNLVSLDEKATDVYYSVLPAKQRKVFRSQEFKLPIIYK